jgi:hypothetical protein
MLSILGVRPGLASVAVCGPCEDHARARERAGCTRFVRRGASCPEAKYATASSVRRLFAVYALIRCNRIAMMHGCEAASQQNRKFALWHTVRLLDLRRSASRESGPERTAKPRT